MTAVLYAARGGSATTSDLYTVDPATSVTTSVGPTGFGLTGLAFDPLTGILYGATNSNSSAHPKSLVTIDPVTGAGTFVGTFGGKAINDIAFKSDGTLYGWSISDNKICTIDKATGAVSLLSSSGITGSFGNGLGITSAGVFYICPKGNNGDLYSGDLGTGPLTDLGALDASGLTDGSSNISAVAFSASDVFWAISLDSATTGTLVTLDIPSRVWTEIGTGLGGAHNWDALAWGPSGGGGGGGGLTTPEGFCIAFDDDALEPTPVWTRLDDPDAPIGRLRVSQVSIDRGMEGTSGTVKTGTAAITLHDPYGELDPTNAGSPFYGKLDPCLQAAYARWNPVTSTWSTRFRGFVKAYRTTMNTSGFADVVIELVDAFDLFATLRLTPGDQGDTPRTESVGDIFYAGGSPIPADDTFKHVDDRINQALDDAGWPATMRDIFSGNVSVQEQVYERDGQLIEVLSDAADAEFPDVSRAYMSAEGIYRFRGRYARFFPDHVGYGITTWILGGAAEAEADAGVVKIQNFSFRRSSEDIINVATALPKGLADSDVPGQMVTDATSIAKFWRRPWMSDNLLTWHGHDDVGATVLAAPETKKFGQFKVDNFKDPKTRIEQIVVTWQHPAGWSGPANWAFLQGVELSDIVSVDTTHPGGGGFAEDYYVEAIREVDEPGPNAATRKVTMQLDVSPKSFYASNPFGTVDDGAS